MYDSMPPIVSHALALSICLIFLVLDEHILAPILSLNLTAELLLLLDIDFKCTLLIILQFIMTTLRLLIDNHFVVFFI